MGYVLIVDDDEDFADTVSTVLRAAGHETAVELSTQEGRASMESRRPDVVVLDVMFPESDSAGFEMARTIKQKFGDMPILMLTGVNQEYPLGFSKDDIDEGWLPVTHFMEKPPDLKQLCVRVSELLEAAG